MELRRVFERIFSKGGEVVHRKDMPNVTLAKMRLASHPQASSQTLMKLSRHGWESIVARVAENPNTESEILVKLAAHAHPDVRMALTENPNTPPRVLVMLAADDHVDVRYSLAENHNAPLSVLDLLCNDENPYVADRANKTRDRVRQTRFNSAAWFPAFRERQQDRG